MTFKCRITARQFAKMTPESLVSRIALQEGGAKANDAIEDRATTTNRAPDGRRIAPKRVKDYRPREHWAGKRRGAFDNKAKANAVPPVIFQQIRKIGGVIRSLEAYEAQGLKGGTPLRAERAQTWAGREWKVGDQWGYYWENPRDFLRDQGKGDLLRLGGPGSRVWASARATVQSSGRNLKLVLGYRGRVRGDATQVLRDTQGETRTGKAKKATPAQIVGIANSRDEQGLIGKPAQTGGKPEGGVAPLADGSVTTPVRWHALSRGELNRTIIKAIATAQRDAVRKLPISVVLIEKGQRRKVK